MQVCTSLQTDNHASTPPLSAHFQRLHVYYISAKKLHCKAIHNTHGHTDRCSVACQSSCSSREQLVRSLHQLSQPSCCPCGWKRLTTQALNAVTTRSSDIAEGPRDASCQLKSCQLPRNSAETTYTTSPGQIDGMKL